jgi:hypothetical protein
MSWIDWIILLTYMHMGGTCHGGMDGREDTYEYISVTIHISILSMLYISNKNIIHKYFRPGTRTHR